MYNCCGIKGMDFGNITMLELDAARSSARVFAVIRWMEPTALWLGFLSQSQKCIWKNWRPKYSNSTGLRTVQYTTVYSMYCTVQYPKQYCAVRSSAKQLTLLYWMSVEFGRQDGKIHQRYCSECVVWVSEIHSWLFVAGSLTEKDSKLASLPPKWHPR